VVKNDSFVSNKAIAEEEEFASTLGGCTTKFVAKNACSREQLSIKYLHHERKQRGGYNAWR
jgi:hypothetical protein